MCTIHRRLEEILFMASPSVPGGASTPRPDPDTDSPDPDTDSETHRQCMDSYDAEGAAAVCKNWVGGDVPPPHIPESSAEMQERLLRQQKLAKLITSRAARHESRASPRCLRRNSISPRMISPRADSPRDRGKINKLPLLVRSLAAAREQRNFEVGHTQEATGVSASKEGEEEEVSEYC